MRLFAALLLLIVSPAFGGEVYVKRDADGNVNGVFRAMQPGIAEELINDADPDVLAYKNRPSPARKSAEQKELDALIKTLLADGITTREKIDAELSKGTESLIKQER